MERFIRFSHQDKIIGELSQNDVLTLERHEEINGEHSLEITTIQVLEKGERIIYQDARGVWREYEVVGIDEEHASGNRLVGSYYCTWSIQPDLLGVTVSRMPGVQSPVTARVALEAALSEQTRWTVGTVTNTSTGGASMYDMDAWKALSVMVETWGGELSTSFAVDANGVTARKVDYYAQQGAHVAKRRFDFGADMKSIKRTMEDEPLYCRISPRGKGEQTESGGYGRKITIESVNGGNDWLQYTPMVDIAKISDGNGGWQYPTLIIENGDCETPAALKTWAQSVMAEKLTPKVTYEIDVLQAAREGIDLQGISLGDYVHVVDRKFAGNGLRLEGRVVAQVVDEITGHATSVTIGYLKKSLSTLVGASKMAVEAYERISGLQRTLATSDYVNNLITRLNTEINATGGYTYITPGYGIRTYDTEVSDPLIGAEASKVVEIKGGSIRIADSKTAQGEWIWRTVFVSGHVAADLVTAAHLTAGYIGSPSGNYWNLDTGELRMASNATVGGKEIATSDVALSDVDVQFRYSDSPTELTGNYEWSTTAPPWINGKYIWQRTKTTNANGDIDYSDATCISGANGQNGTSGYSNAVVFLYKRSETTPEVPTGSFVYYFETGRLMVDQGTNPGWTQYVPNGTAPCWVMSAAASSVNTYDIIAATEFTSPVKLSQNGLDGINQATIFLYQRSATKPSVPSNTGVYTFATGTLDIPYETNWSRTIPASNSQPCWVTTAAAISSEPTYDIGRIDWSEPVKLVEDGSSIGLSVIEYGTSDTATTQPSSWSQTPPTTIAQGKWLWVKTTYSDGTYSVTKARQGTDGQDGTSVNILGSYDTYAHLKADHPTGNAGDAYIIDGDLYVWSLNDSDWMNVGTVQGPAGANGTSVTVSKIEYGTSNSAGTQPSSWSTTVPTSITKGTWVWVKTSYSDGSTALTKSYAGTDGEDGTSVTIRSSTKADGVTTIVLANGDGTTSTLSIADGNDGATGTPGANGYVHVAWANSADGSQDFSTSVSLGKSHIGVYTDNVAIDSVRYQDYSWSLIKGTDGKSITVRSIEYGTSASATVAPSNWSSTAPTTLTKGTWLWVKTTYSDNNSSMTKSYIGTDGEDGSSVYIQSSSKVDGITTLVVSDGTTQTTLSIADGEDGANGTPGARGADGRSSYVHFAWANSEDGRTGFSKTDSVNKRYIGVYTDNLVADSDNPTDYSWSLIKGADGLNNATVTLYIRAASTPAKPTSQMAYKFSTGELFYNTSNWTQDIPSGTNPCWVIAATAISSEDMDYIPANEWSDPVKLSENGMNQANVMIYKRSATQPTAPTNRMMYVFSSGILQGLSDGWTRYMPSNDGNPCWVSSAVAIASVDFDYIEPSEWSTVIELAGDGMDGIGVSQITEEYYLSTSAAIQTGGSWSTQQPIWLEGTYIWTRTKVDWTNGETTYTDPVLAKAINGAHESIVELNNSFDQEEIFNRLTNNGRVQGIYLENGQLYINGNYIKARTIKTVDLETTGVITSLGDLINDNGWIRDTRDTRIRLQSGAERFERKVGNSWKTVGSLCSVPGIGVPDEFYIGSEGYLEIYAKEKLFTTNSSHSGTGLSKDIIIPYVYHNIDTNRETRAYLRMRFINGMLVYIQPRYSGSGDTPIITDY